MAEFNWSDAELRDLLGTPDRDLKEVYPTYTRAQLRKLKHVAAARRDDAVSRYQKDPTSIPDHEAALWVSKAELARRKRQEYNEAMGLVGDILAGQPTAEKNAEQKVAHFLHKLSDDENAYLSQRTARSVSLSSARELLLWRHIEARIQKSAEGIQARPSGYACRKSDPAGAPIRRVLNQLWTDHHNGASLPAAELPVGYDERAQRRRFAHVLQNALEYKRDYRNYTAAHVYDAGDNMEGFLAHDMRSGEPLADQFALTLEYRIQATEHLAAEFPQVHIWIKPGNHDRNKLRHPGRATFQKWDSYQIMLGHAWRAACKRLPNVTFYIDKRPSAAVDVLGHPHFITHGDTNLNLGNPGTSLRVDKIVSQMNSINATRRYGGPFRVFAAGHVHTSVQMEVEGVDLFINGALCPSSGYSDALGYYTSCSQWLWETTERYAVGDMRRIRAGREQDDDAALDAVITPINVWEVAND